MLALIVISVSPSFEKINETFFHFLYRVMLFAGMLGDMAILATLLEG